MSAGAPLLHVEGLTLHYGAAQALFGLSVLVEPGDTVALVGANGAGKSSFLKALLGLLPTSGGKVTFDGRDITRWSTRRRVTAGIALAPEGREVFPGLSVKENLELGALPHGVSGGELARRIDEIYARFPRLQERRAQSAGTLSGGEQQMVAIGRALMAAPRLLLLDEPSLGLAPLIADEIFASLQELAKAGLTTLLIEQNASRALCGSSRAYVLANGRVVREGASRELLVDPDLHRAFLGGAPEPVPVETGTLEQPKPEPLAHGLYETSDDGLLPGLADLVAQVPGLGGAYRVHADHAAAKGRIFVLAERGQGVEPRRGADLARELAYRIKQRRLAVPVIEVVEYGSLPRAS